MSKKEKDKKPAGNERFEYAIDDLTDFEREVLDALREKTEAEFEALAKAEDLCSPEFLLRMERMFREHERAELERIHKKRRWAKILAGVAGFILVCGLLYVPARAGWGIPFFANIYDKYVIGSLVDVSLTQVAPEVNGEIEKQYSGIFVLTKLPDGYEISEKIGNLKNLHLTYSDGINSVLFIQQATSDIHGGDGESESLNKFEQNGIVYSYSRKKENGEVKRVIEWEISDTKFTLIAPFSKEELVTIAESIKYIK